MRCSGNQVTDLVVAYIGGGSRGWAWSLMSDLALEEQLSGTVRLYDIDSGAAQENCVIGNRLTTRNETRGKWHYEVKENLGDALSGADFVVLSILPGTFKEMASDVHLPEEYGIYQSVGDTVGPGGLVRALRTIPMYVEFAEAIQRNCPDAWVINYTNPMTLCTRTLYEVFPQIKAFGCCHEVFGTQTLLAAMLKTMRGIDQVERSEIKVNVLGINHFTWLDSASYQGEDLFPLYGEFTDLYYEEGFVTEKHQDGWMNQYFGSANRVKFDLFKRYGIIAAAGDRHLAEFCPSWYLKNPETTAHWKFGLTPVSWRIGHLKERVEKGRRLLAGEEEFELKPSGEEGVLQMKALLGLGDLVTNVNMPNVGQIEGFPPGSVLETNAVFTRNSLRPVMAGKLPGDVYNLVIRHVINQETILKAALTKNKDLAFRAYANDPLVSIGIREAWDLFNKMLRNTADYLPGWAL